MAAKDVGRLRLLRRYACTVVGYNWLVAFTVLPLALLVVAPLSAARRGSASRPPVPVGALFSAGFVLFEATAFCAERSWSRVACWRFWMLAAPVCAMQALLCMTFSRNDALGCLLLSATCLGLREALFEALHAGASMVGYEAKERATAALMGGFAYSVSLTLLCAATVALVRVAQRGVVARGALTVSTIFLAGVLPLARTLARMILAQAAGGSSPDLLPDLSGGRGSSLDTLVLHSDLVFALAMFLEVPYMFILLAAPMKGMFWTAAVTGAALDVFFAYTLDALQRRRLHFPAKQAEAEHWSPSFCPERPVGLVAALLGGLPPAPLEPETEPLLPRAQGRGPPLGAGPTGAAPEGGATPPADGAAVAGEPVVERALSSKGGGPMSPRVSLLLDEYDEALVECRLRTPAAQATRGGQAVYLLQDRKITFMTHLLVNTVALALAVLFVPALTLHRLQGRELATRAAGAVALRICSDTAACWTLEHTSSTVQYDSHSALWESRHELVTLHGWCFRALASVCPLFVVSVIL